MFIIKVTSPSQLFSEILLRQTKNSLGIWSDCQFVFDDNLEECDMWVIMHNSSISRPITTKYCPPNKILYISMEPSESDFSITNKFLNQFSTVVLVDRKVKHRSIIYENIFSWWIGVKVSIVNGLHVFNTQSMLDYDYFSKINHPQPERLNRFALISSNKLYLPGHIARVSFIHSLLNSPIGDKVDVYGFGFKDFDDKSEILNRYKYSIVVENACIENLWTEKLADAFLAFSYPIYYGAPNIKDFFPENSFSIIDISDVDSVVATLACLLHSNTYDFSYQHLLASRDKVIHRYNLFARIAFFNTLSTSEEPVQCVLYPNHFYRLRLNRLIKHFSRSLHIFWLIHSISKLIKWLLRIPNRA